MIIWGTPVSGLQFFGYSIALGGLAYYKLGGDAIKEYAGNAGRSWAQFGNERPVLRKVVIIFAAFLVAFILLGGLAPTFAPETTAESIKEMKSMLGGVTSGTKGR